MAGLDRNLLYPYLRETRAWHTLDTDFRHPAHAYLLVSEDRITLEAMADLVCARAYCDTACGHCAECNKVFNHTKVDVSYPNEYGEAMKIAAAQNIVEDAMLGSFEGGKKVYVIASCELQSERVQNALLKTLEEPHDNVLFLLLASSTAGILSTVLSRVKMVNIAPYSPHTLARILDQMGVENAEVLARSGGGNLSAAWQLADQEGYFDLVDEVFEMLTQLNTLGKVCEYIYRPLFSKENIAQTLQVMGLVCRDMLYWAAGLKDSVTYSMKQGDLAALVSQFPLGSLAPISDLIEEAKQKVNSYCVPANVADSLLAGIVEVKQA